MRKNNFYIPVFVIGFIVGMIVMNLGKSTLLQGTKILDKSTLQELLLYQPRSSALFAYIFRKRFLEFLVLVVLATTYLGIGICVLTCGWYGFAAGSFLSAGVLRYGIKGVFLVLAAMLPQYLLYGPMLYRLFTWCDTTCRQIYGKTKAPLRAERVLSLIVLLVLLFCGCMAEAFLNPGILRSAIRLL